MDKGVVSVLRMARQHIELCAPDSTVLAELDKAADAVAKLVKRNADMAKALNAVLRFAEHAESCGDADAYNRVCLHSCGCGLDTTVAFAHEVLAICEPENPNG